MKIVRYILPALLLLIMTGGASTASAQTPDPRVTLAGGGSCETEIITSLTEEFDNLDVGCKVDFTNCIGGADVDNTCVLPEGAGETLGIEVVNILSGLTGTLTCALGEGAPLGGTPTPSDNSACSFTGAPGSPGITPDSTFSLEFDDLDGSFNTPLDVTLAPNVLPEPGTILLLGIGLVLLLVGTKGAGLRGRTANWAS